MRLSTRLLAIALVALWAGSARAVVTPIGDLRCNFSNGIPLQNGQLVTVQGTVTMPQGLLSPTNIDCHIQDATGAIDVFIGNGVGTFSFVLGDSVEVTGWVKHFNGLTEIDSTGFVTVTQLGQAALPAPLVLTCLEAANSYQGDCDPNESRLIRINDVHLSGGAWPTSVSTANTTLTIQDATGTTTLFIDKDTPVNGSPNPGSKFDIIGVLRQFDSSAPFTAGYQIVPRFVTDVIPDCPGPGFATNPEASVLDSLSATISWTTQTPGTSYINYGQTTAYDFRVGDATPTTTHQVVLTGLQPRTMYHYQAESGDVNGTCFALDRGVVTYPSPGTPGDITVYFNQSVDPSFSRGPLAQGYVDTHVHMIPLIDAAHTSIDCAFYAFSLPDVADHLIDAHNRGVLVRVITDISNSQTQANRLAAAGIPVITSAYGGLNHGQAAGFGIMHDKYMVVDAKSPNKDDAYMWTGSWNVSFEGQAEANNTVVFHDYGLAAAYTLDFDQMWGSSTPTPSATASKMGSRKAEVMPHRFRVGGVPVEAYMSPSDLPEGHMIQYIQEAQRSQQFCIFDFTSDPLSHAMKVHRDSIPGFIVRGNFEGSQVGSASEWCKLTGDPSCPDFWSPRADVTLNTSPYFTLLHHKYQILDESDPARALVWTGSHNWSAAAKTNNDENTVVIHDAATANLYFQEFGARFTESGGTIALSHAAVIFPNNGELLFIGAPVELQWSMTGNSGPIATVDLYMSRDHGVHYTPLALGVPNTGSYAWTVSPPATNTTTFTPVFSALFRVVGVDPAGNPGSDVSDTPFAIFNAPVDAMVTRFDTEPADFGITIRWALSSSARFSSIDLERSETEAGPWTAVDAAHQELAGTTVVEDRTAEVGTSYWYRLVASTGDGTPAVFGPVKGEAAAPREFALRAVWPNPSSGSIQAEFSVARTAPVRLSVLDLQGREVQVLANGEFAPGRYHMTWDGRTSRGPASAGMYFVRYQSPAKTMVHRVVISR